MAEDKKSFVAYADWQSQFNLLSDDEAGRLIKHLFSYVNDESPEFSASDRLLIMAFEPIKNQLKRDLKKYETIKKRRSEAGKKSAEIRAKSVDQESTNLTSDDFVKQEPTNPTVNDIVNGTDTVNVNGTDTVTVTDNDLKGLLGAEAQKKSKADFEQDKIPKKPDKVEKEKSSAEKEKFGKPEFRQALIDAGVEEQHADDWIKVRTAKRAAFTLTVIESLFKECEANNFKIKDAVRISAEQSWQGFKYAWIQNINTQNNGKQTGITASQGRQQRVDEVEQFRVDNQKSLASRLQKHITGNTEQPAVNSEN